MTLQKTLLSIHKQNHKIANSLDTNLLPQSISAEITKATHLNEYTRTVIVK